MNNLFRNRRSVRKFTDREVSDKQIKEILNAAMVAPSGNHKCPWEFVVVKDKKVLKKLSKVGMWVGFVSNSSVSIVITAKPSDSDMWVQDCSLTAGHIYLESTNQGLGCCWGNVKGEDSQEGRKERVVKKILNIPDDYRVLCIMAIGYPKNEVAPHSEEAYKEEKIHMEVW